MKKLSKELCVGLLCGLAAGAVVLLATPTSGAAENLTIAIREQPSTPDPHWTTQPATFQINVMYYEPLVRLSADGVPSAHLAEKWDRPDETTWVFHLRKNVKFHDGSLFTAEDVKFSYERAGNLPGAPQSFRTYVRPIKAMEVIDANTLKITTDGPAPALLERLTYVLIVSKKSGEKNSNEDYNNGRNVIGTGPYKFVSWTMNDNATVVRFDDYWGEKQPWEKVTVRSIPSDPSRLAALLSGDIDVMQTVPSADIDRVKKDPKVTVYTKLTGRIAYLSFNPNASLDEGPAKITGPNGEKLTDNPFKNKLVREALALGIEREAFVKRIYQGEAEATGQYLLPGKPGSLAGEIAAPKADPARARKLLEESGWLGKFKVELAVGSTFFPQSVQTAEAIAQSWTRIGVPTTVQSIATPVYTEARIKQRIPVTVIGYVNSIGSADAMFPLTVHSRDLKNGYGTLNFVEGHKNAEVDRLIEEAEKTTDVAKRTKMFEDAHRLALADYISIPLWFFYTVNATKKPLTMVPRVDSQVVPQDIKPVAAASAGAAKK